MSDLIDLKPDARVSVRERFGLHSPLTVPAFRERDAHVPEIDAAYRFNHDVTLAILAGFAQDRRVLVQGLHGTGKSTHIEQVAARLNWPCVRVNLDGHVSRLDLVGRDAVVLRDGQQVTEFQPGIVPWALQRPVALVFDEYDAGRPDVMFVIQRVLEREGKFTLMDQNRVLSPHPAFRLFATANTVGLGNLNGLYHGAQRLNHAQIDRWNIVATLNFLPADEEVAIVLARVPALADDAGRSLAHRMVAMADLTRQGFAAGDLSTLMSPRTVITWAENLQIFGDVALAFRLSFGNKCDDAEKPLVAEYFQRCFDLELQAPPVRPGESVPPGPGCARPPPRGLSKVAKPHLLMSQVQATARHQQQVEELCVAAIRALAGQRDLHFRGRRLHRGWQRLPLFAPHLHPHLDRDDFRSFRGAADGLALRLRMSDDALHRSLLPAEPMRRLLFDLLEQYRCEALAGDQWPGVQRNLQHRFERWTLAYHDSGLSDSARGLLLFTVAQIARARVTLQPPLEAIEDLMETTRGGIAPLLGHGLATLRRTRHDQAAYAQAALAIADAVAQLLEDADGPALVTTDDGPREADERTAFGFMMDLDDVAEGDGIATVATGRSRVLQDSAGGYRIFTSAYDRELRPAASMRREQLDQFRLQLDSRVAAQGLNLSRLARQLQAVLSKARRDDWASAQEEGLIDGRRLSQLVASPTERRLFRLELQEPQSDAVVAFLIDCSGSMRQHIESIAMLVDVFARTLQMAEVPCEVLGFSTGAWHGGRAMRDWQRAGRPRHPGRLAETAHLVFKDADTPWRHARHDIAALLRPDLFREGVDGEALAWAATRLRRRDESRKLLIVVSDGCPMEGATQQANDAQYLDHHLQQVAAEIESAGDIELAAVGVGLDLSPYYGRCQAIDLDAALGSRVFNEIVALISHRSRR